MSRHGRIGSALLLAVAMSLGACATQRQQEVDAAPPSADHRQLAHYYAREARRQDAGALKHDEVARSYAGSSSGVNDGLWARHCGRLAARLHDAARDSLALARLHERAAAAE